MWLDSRTCPDTFHDIIRRDGKWIVLHGDGEECLAVEFGKSKGEDDDDD